MGGSIGTGGRSGTGGRTSMGGSGGASTARGGSGGGAGNGGAGGSTGSGGATTGVCSAYVPAAVDAGSTQGLVAYYPCESANGTLLPDVYGNNNATLVTGTGGTPGYGFAPGKTGNGNALDLVKASRGYVTLPAGLLDNACEATIATWVYINSTADWQRIFDFGKDQTVYMFLTPSNSLTHVLRFAISVSGNGNEQIIDGNAALPTGAWNHVAVVLGLGGGILYLNGAQVGSNAGLILRPADLGSVPNYYIGRSEYSTDPYLDGDVDEIRIYNRALGPTEIQALASGS